MFRFCQFAILLAFGASFSTGCGSREDIDSAGIKETAAGVIVSVNAPDQEPLPTDGATLGSNATAEDKVTTALKTISQLRAAPLPEDIQQARDARRIRNLHIVQLATSVLRLTIEQEDRDQHFAAGIRQLLEARFQLALNGSAQDIDQLYADVQALSDRDPNSDHAAEGIYYLAKFAHTKARLLGRSDVVWFENFSRWAREFADRFPAQQDRAAALLFGAGRSCEMHSVVTDSATEASRLKTEAKLCYTTLTEQFASTTQAAEAVAVLRRMGLPGNRLSQFAGPTLTGNYVNADQFVDKVTVIYFWDEQNPEFREKLLPLLQQADDASNNQLRFVGVPMAEDKATLQTYLQQNQVPGQQIFFADAAQRSWNSPLVRFWGISSCPSVWLIDRNGVVKSVDVGGLQLVETMRQLFE